MWLVNGTQSRNSSKLKHVFPLGLIFLANMVWEHTKVPYNSALGPVLSPNQQLGTSAPHVKTLLYLFKDDITGCHPHHWVKHYWCHTLLAGNFYTCIQTGEQQSLARSISDCVTMLKLFLQVRDSDPGHTLWHIYFFLLSFSHILFHIYFSIFLIYMHIFVLYFSNSVSPYM